MANDISYPGYGTLTNERVRNTILPKFIREVEQANTRNYQILALIESLGNKVMGEGGNGFSWPVAYKMHRAETYTGETTRVFSQQDQHKLANLDWRGYQITDAMKFREFEMAKGPEAVINIFKSFGQRMTDSMKFNLATECFVDGTTSANSRSWHGFESLFGTAGNSIKIDDNTDRTANAADVFLAPSTVYAGLRTDRGNYGGDLESGASWPLGRSSPEYDFWTPGIINYKSTDTSLLSGTGTWAANCEFAMRTGILRTQRNTTAETQISNVLLAPDLYQAFQNYWSNKVRIVPKESETSLLKLGFQNVINFDGVEVSLDHAIDPGLGYGFNPRNIMLRCMYSQMYKFVGPIVDETASQYNFVLSNLSNLQFKSPRNFFKLVNGT